MTEAEAKRLHEYHCQARNCREYGGHGARTTPFERVYEGISTGYSADYVGLSDDPAVRSAMFGPGEDYEGRDSAD